MTNNQKFSITGWNLPIIPTGTYFSATSNGKLVEGLVHNEKDEYIQFCFDNAALDEDGEEMGFPHSVLIWYDDDNAKILTPAALDKKMGMKGVSFPAKPRSFKKPVVLPEFNGYVPRIHSGYVEFGCQTVLNTTILQLHKQLLPEKSRKKGFYFGQLASKAAYIYPGHVSIDFRNIPNSQVELLVKNLKA